MDRNPRSKKALIITTVVVLALLFAVYFLFIKADILGTKGDSSGKKFAPLFGTPKEKTLSPLDDKDGNGIKDSEEVEVDSGDTTPSSNGVGTSGNGSQNGTGENSTGNLGNISANLIIPPLQSLPTPDGMSGFSFANLNTEVSRLIDPCDNSEEKVKRVGSKELVDNNGNLCAGIPSSALPKVDLKLTPECSDGVDNDKDKLIDRKDPQCHTDGNAKNNGPATKQTVAHDPGPSGTIGGAPKIGTCNDKRDNNLDGKVDVMDPNCHRDGIVGNLFSYDPSILEGTECSDNVDNDFNGLMDKNDPACHIDQNPQNQASYDRNIDNEYTKVYECSDGKDTDGNGLTDKNDPSCHTDKNAKNAKSYDPKIDSEGTDTYDSTITSEAKGRTGGVGGGTAGGGVNLVPQCSDGIDNDGDKLVDTKDPGCHDDLDATNANSYNKDKYSEINFIPECNDGKDNDGDGLADSKDPGCHDDLDPNNGASYNKQKYSEYNFLAQCSDGTDNDGDKLVDTKDPGCHSDGNAGNAKSYDKNRSLEFNLIPQCSDGKDNDGDKLVDDQDSACWTDSKNPKTYNPEFGSEFDFISTTTTNTTNTGGKQCKEEDMKLKFTADELRQLAELTKQFNRIAPFLKSEFDVKAEENAKLSYQSVIDNARELTNQCYTQKQDSVYTKNSSAVDVVDLTGAKKKITSKTDAIDFYDRLTTPDKNKIAGVIVDSELSKLPDGPGAYFIRILAGGVEYDYGTLKDHPSAYKFRIYKKCTQLCFNGHKTNVSEFGGQDYLDVDFRTAFIDNVLTFNQSQMAVVDSILNPSQKYSKIVTNSITNKGRNESKGNMYYDSDEYPSYSYIRRPGSYGYSTSYFNQYYVDSTFGYLMYPWATFEQTFDIW